MTAMPGVVTIGQVLEAVLATVAPAQMSRAVAVRELVTEQRFVVTPKLPLKVAEAPGASEAARNTTVLAAG